MAPFSCVLAYVLGVSSCQIGTFWGVVLRVLNFWGREGGERGGDGIGEGGEGRGVGEHPRVASGTEY